MDPMATINEALLRTNRRKPTAPAAEGGTFTSKPPATVAPDPTGGFVGAPPGPGRTLNSGLPPGTLTYPEAPEIGGNWAGQGTTQVPVGVAGAQRAPISGVFNSTPVPTQAGIAGAAGRPPIRAGAPGGSGIDLLQQAAAAVAARGR